MTLLTQNVFHLLKSFVKKEKIAYSIINGTTDWSLMNYSLSGGLQGYYLRIFIDIALVI